MKNLKTVLASPYILSLIPFILIVLPIQNGLNRYILENESSVISPENNYTWFDDLNNDGSSEKIVAFDQNNSTGLAISTDNGIIEQWNFLEKTDKLTTLRRFKLTTSRRSKLTTPRRIKLTT